MRRRSWTARSPPWIGWRCSRIRAVPEMEDEALREVIYKGYRVFHLVSGPEGEEEVEVLTVFYSSRQFGGGEGLEPQ